MPDWIDLLETSAQTARPTATSMDAATGTIATLSDAFFPWYVCKFGARVTTAWGVTASVAAKWQLEVLDIDDTTVLDKAAITFNQGSAAIGDVIYADLEQNGLAFQLEPGQRLRYTQATQGVSTGGSAIGAAIPMVAWKRDSDNPLAESYTSAPKVTRVTATSS